MRTQAKRSPQRHGGMDSVFPRFIGCRGNDASFPRLPMACPCRLCHPDAVVMKSAQERCRHDAPGRLNGPAHRCVLPEGEMCANLIIIGGVSCQDPAQMRFAEHDDMVEALTSDRADETFNMAVLPRRAGRNGSVPDTHRSEPPCDDGAVTAIPIADGVSRCLIPWERLGDLARDPLCRGVRGDISQDRRPSLKTQDRQTIQESEADGRYDEEVNGCNLWRMIVEEGPPAL